MRAYRFVFAVLAALFMLTSVDASAQIHTRQVDCLFEHQGHTYIDGPCEFLTDGKYYGVGGFRIANYDDGHVRYDAEVTISSPGVADAVWNETAGGAEETGKLGEVRSNGACWTNSDTRICAWKLGEGRPGFAARGDPTLGQAPYERSQGTSTWKTDCFFEADGTVYLDGACRFMKNDFYGPGGFALASLMSDPKLFIVEAQRTEQTASGTVAGVWNGRSGSTRVATPLGDLRQNGPCWESARARVCAWKLGDGRGDFRVNRTPVAGATAPPAAANGGGNANASANANANAGDTQGVTTLTFHGKCQSLVIDGDDATSRCSPVMQNHSIAGDPATAFGFGTSDGSTIIYFEGADPGQVQNTMLRQPISYVMLIVKGGHRKIPATGSCTFPNPSVPVVAQCEAKTSGSTYAARFLTDGAKPEVKRR